MPRPPNPIKPRLLNLSLPEDLHTRVTLLLYSELEGRVPHGAYSEFFCARIREYFATKELDLAPWTGAAPGAFVVRGTEETLTALKGVMYK